MRKIALASAAFLFLSLSSQAQISKGTLFLGGSFGLHTGKQENNTSPSESESFGWSVFPQIGKAIGENRIVGLRFGVSNSNQEYRDAQQTQAVDFSNFSAGVFYRRYFPLGAKFYLFGEAGADYGRSKQERKQNNSLDFTQKTRSASVDITPGLSYVASRKLHLEASLNRLASLSYAWMETTNYPMTPGGQISTTSGSNVSLTGNGSGFSAITIGLRWFLPRKA